MPERVFVDAGAMIESARFVYAPHQAWLEPADAKAELERRASARLFETVYAARLVAELDSSEAADRLHALRRLALMPEIVPDDERVIRRVIELTYDDAYVLSDECVKQDTKRSPSADNRVRNVDSSGPPRDCHYYPDHVETAAVELLTKLLARPSTSMEMLRHFEEHPDQVERLGPIMGSTPHSGRIRLPIFERAAAARSAETRIGLMRLAGLLRYYPDDRKVLEALLGDSSPEVAFRAAVAVLMWNRPADPLRPQAIAIVVDAIADPRKRALVDWGVSQMNEKVPDELAPSLLELFRTRRTPRLARGLGRFSSRADEVLPFMLACVHADVDDELTAACAGAVAMLGYADVYRKDLLSVVDRGPVTLRAVTQILDWPPRSNDLATLRRLKSAYGKVCGWRDTGGGKPSDPYPPCDHAHSAITYYAFGVM